MCRLIAVGAAILIALCEPAFSVPPTDGPTRPDAIMPDPESGMQRPPPRPDAAPAAPPSAVSPAASGPIAESDFDHSACLLSLYLTGTTYDALPPIREQDGRGCGISHPVQITQILPGITLTGQPVMRCETARQLTFWLRDFVIPATKRLPGRPQLASVQTGSAYLCRDRIGDDSADLSEHALGNALDIMSLGFRDGSEIAIAPRQDQGDLTEAFQRAIQGAACLYFTTVLGPGSNAAHDDHLHLDIKSRKGGWRLCQ